VIINFFSSVVTRFESSFVIVENRNTFDKIIEAIKREDESDFLHKRNVEELKRQDEMYELALRLSEIEAKYEIENEITEDETREMQRQIEGMDLGEITLGGLNSTGIILETVYRSGVEGMLDRK